MYELELFKHVGTFPIEDSHVLEIGQFNLNDHYYVSDKQCEIFHDTTEDLKREWIKSFALHYGFIALHVLWIYLFW